MIRGPNTGRRSDCRGAEMASTESSNQNLLIKRSYIEATSESDSIAHLILTKVQVRSNLLQHRIRNTYAQIGESTSILAKR